MSRKAKQQRKEYLEKREKGFDLGCLEQVRIKEYNALYDPNMRHFFESKHNQYLLYTTGQIDSHGRVIDAVKNKSKLHILEREFAEAEKVEEKRQQEEMEMRYRVQRKRFNELEKAKKSEILEKLKAERDLSKEIVSTLRMSATGGFDASKSLKKSSKTMSKSSSKRSDGFFITESEHKT